MTTDLEQRLRDALRDDAERARLVNPDRPAEPEERSLPVVPNSGRSPRRLIAVAAAVALIVAGTVAVIQDGDDGADVSTTPRPNLVFTDVAPGDTVVLPPAPVSANGPAIVWSGTEMIVWGGILGGSSVGDGAAFNLATGTWRTIAAAPVEGRAYAQAAWTGTEMIVVGGFSRTGSQDDTLRDGAAYNPTTDTWRTLPSAPINLREGSSPVWTGEELVVLGNGAAAYNPETNSWSQLAGPPAGSSPEMVWTGETILMSVETPVEGFETDADPSSLVRYDLDSDEWQTVDDEGYTALVGVPDASGDVESVLALPDDVGAPVAVLDRAGNTVGTLQAFPGDPSEFGDRIQAVAEGAYTSSGWLGEEALFWIGSADSSIKSAPEPWTLNPGTGAWRLLDGNAPPLGVHLDLAADAGVLVGWGRYIDDFIVGTSGLLYGPPIPARDGVEPPATGITVAEPQGAPAEQPADPVAAEAEIRAAFTGIFDASLPREERAQFSDRPDVWLPANLQLVTGSFGYMVQNQRAQVDSVEFVDATRAAVDFHLLDVDSAVPIDHVGDAVLVDGRWLVSITTTCRMVEIASVTCDMTP